MQQWIVLFSQPNKEFLVQDILTGQDVETYLPTTKPARPRSDRRKEIPFFTRYLFANVDLEVVPKSSLRWTPGMTSVVSFGSMTSVVSFGSEIAVVDQEVIDFIRRRVTHVAEQGYGGLQWGDVVRITRGPFRDIEAIFEKPISASGRVRILIDVLGRLTNCEIGFEDLERVRACA